ncbi:hypothetical protein ACIQC5_17625 [Paenarthrobacter sp. NPDC092416]|uniref:hypothetical protein n=1 Tax=Paenarthrobacter sp. NPDC092416 TaxID=3364386 RepID=UPI0038246817
MAFQFEELLTGAARLDDLVEQLVAIEDEARSVQHALEPYLFDSYATGCTAIDAVADSGYRIARVRQELDSISSRVRASHRDYQQAESNNVWRMRFGLDLQYSLGRAILGRPGSKDWAETLVSLLGPSLMNVRLGLPAGAALAVGALPGFSDAGSALRAVVGIPGLGYLQPRPVTAEKLGESVETVDPSMPGSLRRLDSVHARGQGEIEIIELPNTGSSTWMVLIPGTEPEKENRGGSNPLDEAGIAEALGYGSEEVIPAIRQALREAGAEAGDQVVAVAHSQGGAHAMNLSQDKAFLSEFDLKYVLTAGAPVGGITPEPGIRSMHLEHMDDWVPGSDGQINGDTRDRVTVTLTNPVQTPEGDDFGLGPGHSLKNYASSAALIAGSDDPSLVSSSAAFAGLVGAGGAAKVTRFKLERAPITGSAPVPTPLPGPAPQPALRETKSEAGTR